jgi:hypothetical protein
MNETIEDAYTLLQLGALQRPPEPAGREVGGCCALGGRQLSMQQQASEFPFDVIASIGQLRCAARAG